MLLDLLTEGDRLVLLVFYVLSLTAFYSEDLLFLVYFFKEKALEKIKKTR